MVSNTISNMLEKATKDDVSGFQSYTIRNLDKNLGSEPDIEQYKLLNIQENPLGNQQRYLDVMCFPMLFPDGWFIKYHPVR